MIDLMILLCSTARFVYGVLD